MTRGILAATAAIITFAFAAPASAQDGCWKSTDSVKIYGYMGACASAAKQARRPSRIDEKGAQANAMQVSMRGAPAQCWKSTDSVKIYGYHQACR